MSAATSVERDSLIATVRGADGAIFTATASSRKALSAELVSYISERFDLVLWPAAARAVRALIERGEHERAIVTYFANVGSRWDEEWLEMSAEESSL